jgi:hypothetical protein
MEQRKEALLIVFFQLHNFIHNNIITSAVLVSVVGKTDACPNESEVVLVYMKKMCLLLLHMRE